MNKHLFEAIQKTDPVKLNQAIRRKANDGLIKAGLDGNTRFPKVATAMNAAWAVLDKLGLEPGSTVPYVGGNRGTFSQEIAFSNPSDPFSPSAISNSVFYVQWAKLETGYEVVGYLS